MAVFFHEILHEVGDFALLVQSGFSKRAAMASRSSSRPSAPSSSALIGIAVQEISAAGEAPPATPAAGMSDRPLGHEAFFFFFFLRQGDMLLPFTAGTFLYVGTVAVIPELLETGPNKAVELRKTLMQFAAIAVGAEHHALHFVALTDGCGAAGHNVWAMGTGAISAISCDSFLSPKKG